MDKRFKALKAIADSHGFVLYSQKRHLKWCHPCGAKVTTGMTISDRRAHRNIDNQFRRTLATYQEQKNGSNKTRDRQDHQQEAA